MAAVTVSRSWRLLLLLQATAIAMGGMANALKAATSASSIEKAQGETVVLDCTWTIDPTDTGALDVEWFMQATPTNNYVATFAGGTENIYPEYVSRVRFARNVTQRDASLQIAALQASDDGVYTCKVKVGMVIQQVPIKLTVLVKPSQPSCVVNGSVALGKDLSLQCLSREGTSPISYQWKKTSGEGGMAAFMMGGMLPIKNASVSHSGMYQCNATNRVGWQSCVVLLSVVPPSSNAGVVAGAVIGVLLVVAVIGFLVWYLLRQRKGKPVRDRDYHNDIRMDDSPPASMSRPPTRAAHDLPSTRTSIGSATPSNGLLALRSAPGGPSGPGGPPYERGEGRGRGPGAFPSVREESESGGGPTYESVARDDDYDDDDGSEDDLPPGHSPEPPKPKVAGGGGGGSGLGVGAGGGPVSPASPAHRVNLARMGAVAVMVPAQTRSSVDFA
ncbi:unnamed protein product [Lampetra fluviatilis]